MSHVLEQGEVFFFYRPRVDVDVVRRLDDVQRFFFVLAPAACSLYRRLIVGRKRLPDVHAHERAWAFVAEVADDPQAFRDDLPEARLVGEGEYALVDHDGHTHLAYVLERPPHPGAAQRTFRIEDEGSYVIAVRNPDALAPPGTGLPPRRRPQYPEELRRRFAGRRFSAVDPPELLDYEGAEVVLIGATHGAEAELGIELQPATERLTDADILRELRLPPGELVLEPLERGALR